jgi:hypothetical protein
VIDMGHDDEWELADRLREVLDAPVPPSRTNVDAVISRGRRWLALQRAGAVLGVVAVVGGISVAVLALRGVGDRGGGGARIPPAAAPVATSTTSPGQPGQAWSPVPLPPAPSTRCDGAQTLPAGPGLDPDPPAIAAFVGSVRGAAGQGHVADPVVARKDNVGSVDIFAEVSDTGGVGSVHLFQNPYVGSPLVAADKAAHGYSGCDAVLRVVRPSGAVLQWREKPTLSPPQQTELVDKATGRPAWPYLEPSPRVAIYLPDARVYDLTQSRYASASSKSPSTIHPYIVPRKTLPLTDRQFQAAAEDFVARLGF